MPDSSEKAARETYVSSAVPYDFGEANLLGNPALDNVVTCVVAMGAEMWATKRRLSALEAVLAEQGVSSSAVSNYVPTEQQELEWGAERDRFIQLALGPLGDRSFKNASSDENDFTSF